ncbi:sensor histidine kinase [Amycolatopsis sp. cmx-11-12]|uniref:sensor histidine kinase n=1 Tax=Amycolatopsis sp. cmx-11-12 TaxID=2785795 RepID=UPI0039183A0A
MTTLGVAAVAIAVQIGGLVVVDIRNGSSGSLPAAALLLVSIAILLLGVRWRLRGRGGYPTLALLAGQASVALLLILCFDDWAWAAFPQAGLLFGWLLLIVLPRRWGWLGYLTIVVEESLRYIHATIGKLDDFRATLPPYLSSLISQGIETDLVIAFVANSLMSGGVVYCLLFVAELSHRLRVAQEDVTRLAASEERARMARDLHDTLGQRLTAIMAHGELAEHQLAVSPESARHQVRSIVEVASTALEEVRRVARANRTPRLEQELVGAVRLIESAGARCVLDVVEVSDQPAAAALGWILREATTNILRHSTPTICVITCREAGDGWRLVAENDGVEPHTNADHPGSGIENMSQRMEKIGGWVEAGVVEDGRFRLVAFAPSSHHGSDLASGHGEATEGSIR